MLKKLSYLILISLLIFSSSPIILAQNDQVVNKSAEELFSTALEEYNNQNYKSAAETLDNLLNRNDLNDDLKFNVLYYSTMTAIKRYQTTKAINLLEQFNQAGFQNATLNWRIGELFLNKDGQFGSANFDKALNYLREAESMGLEKIQFKRDLAYTHLESQNLEKAEKLYNEVINQNAVSSDYMNLARIKEKHNQLQEAVKYYESARDTAGNKSGLYLNLGNIYQKLDNHDSAVAIYEEGIEMRNNFAPLYIGLGESYIKLEEYLEAENALEKAVEINDNSYYGYYLLGNLEKQKGNNSQAFNYYDKSLKYNSNYVNAYIAKGQLYIEIEEYQNAISSLSLAVEKNPDYAESRYYLGKAYYNAGMLEAAAAEFRQTVHINDRFPEAKELLEKIENELSNN